MSDIKQQQIGYAKGKEEWWDKALDAAIEVITHGKCMSVCRQGACDRLCPKKYPEKYLKSLKNKQISKGF